MKKTFFIIAILTATATTHDTAHARTLYYGDASVELTDERKTAPALHVQIGEDETVFGALYNIDDLAPPAASLHIGYDNKDYWAGPWCPWWQYLPAGTRECTDIPAEMYNRFLTMEEVRQYIIPSDINAWELISACSAQYVGCGGSVPNPNPTGSCECATGTLQPGKYLILDIYNTASPQAQIALFDHPVGYKSQHSNTYYDTTIDTENEVYKKAVLSSPSYGTKIDAANVTNMPTQKNMYIYRMK